MFSEDLTSPAVATGPNKKNRYISGNHSRFSSSVGSIMLEQQPSEVQNDSTKFERHQLSSLTN